MDVFRIKPIETMLVGTKEVRLRKTLGAMDLVLLGIGCIIGWDLALEYTVGASAVAAGWSAYFTGLLKAAGVELPKHLTSVPADGGLVNLPAVAIVAVLTALLVAGTKESAGFNKALVFVKLAAVVLFLVLAAPHVKVANWSPYLPYGFGGVAAGAAIVFFAYIGFDAVSTAAEEAREPNRDVPVGIIGSLFVCTALYIAVAAVLTGVVPYRELNNAEPVAYALRSVGNNFGGALVAVGAICGITTVLLVLMYGQSRVAFAMSRDGLLPASVCRVHPRFGTPYLMTMLTGAVVAVLAGFLPIGVIAELCNIGTLFAFCLVAVGVWVLRSKRPDIKRPFRCPAIGTVSTLAVLFSAYLMFNLPLATWVRFAAWFAAGLAVYFLYGRKHSTLNSTALK